MPGLLLDEMETPVLPAPMVPEYGFVVSHQKVELEVDFATQTVTGRSEITIHPLQQSLRTLRIDARQCTIPSRGITVNGTVAAYEYEDPMKRLEVPPHYNWKASQYQMQKDRLKPLLDDCTRSEVALEIEIPHSVGIEAVDSYGENANAANSLADRATGATALRNSSIAINGLLDPPSVTSAMTPKTTAEQSPRFQPLVISISFSVSSFRDGLQFVGFGAGDERFPHVYTRHSVDSGTAPCIFPCVDDLSVRCTWDLVIKCSRTLGDALRRRPKPSRNSKKTQANGIPNLVNITSHLEEDSEINDDEKLLDMMVVCSGEMLNEVVDPDDSSKKIVSFSVGTIVAAKHIGFAIGPFEEVDLSEFRDEEDEEKLGQGQSVPVSAFCLPGRAEEARNTCQPMAHAMDWFSLNFARFPFSEYKMVFINDQVREIEHTAGLSLCDIRLLCPEDIIEPEIENTRKLVHALASQWIGVTVVPNEKVDRWITVGLSHFMTGMFMKALCGNNEFMFRQKMLADKLVELDVDRAPLHALGDYLHLGSFEYDFMALKAPLVLFILDRRIIKEAGTAGIARVITKIALGANTGTASDSVLSTEPFRRLVEKITKYRKTEPFWNQWILGSGCPRFSISQKFNKKRLTIEMKITQVQTSLPAPRILKKDEFLRELKEESSEVFAGEPQPVFTGSMTIRIHEADGTPYEHVVDIKEGSATIEIPYSTKYKRLKRSRRQKERAAGGAVDVGAELGEDALIYCLGDILQSQHEMQEWGLIDWNEEQQQDMENESYEWFRIDSDFEWLCSKTLASMMPWMYISQLQQDRDVVAQQESMLWLKHQPPHPLAATFLVRTLMDPRYYYGIRQLAAECLVIHADPVAHWIGWRHLEKAYHELFCYPGTKMPRPNDFSDKKAYWVANAIAKAVSRIRHTDGRCPKEARYFILDQLRFNDNGSNEYSDNYKVANLLTALAHTLLTIKKINKDGVEEMVFALEDGDDDDDPEPHQFRDTVIEELDRFRRSDEWINSYHNIYTTTVLDCKWKLMKAGVIPQDPMEFAQYLHDGTSDHVRIKAWGALIDLGYITDDAVAAFLLNVLSTDSSPYVRSQLLQIFCLGLAGIALDEIKVAEAPLAGADGEGEMLIIEEEVSSNARKDYFARTTSIDGALRALKLELKDNSSIKEAIWIAVQSSALSPHEEYDLLDICWALYAPKDSLVIKLRYPRVWRVENHGKGKLIFKETNKVRIKMGKHRDYKQTQPPQQALPQPKAEPFLGLSSPSIKVSGNLNTSMGPPKQPHKRPLPPERSHSASSEGQQPQKRNKIIKLKVPMDKLTEIQRSPSQPAVPALKSSPSTGSSPAPRPYPAAPIAAPSSSTVFATPILKETEPPGLGMIVKPARKPLPDAAPRKPLPDTTPPLLNRVPSIANKLKLKVPKKKDHTPSN